MPDANTVNANINPRTSTNMQNPIILEIILSLLFISGHQAVAFFFLLNLLYFLYQYWRAEILRKGLFYMSNVKLTKDSDTLICLMYKDYCESRKSGVNKYTAKHFGSCEDIHVTLTPNWSLDDTLETANELRRAGFIDCRYGDGTITDSWMTDDGIIYMESRFENNVNSVIEYISKIKNLIPFI